VAELCPPSLATCPHALRTSEGRHTSMQPPWKRSYPQPGVLCCGSHVPCPCSHQAVTSAFPCHVVRMPCVCDGHHQMSDCGACSHEPDNLQRYARTDGALGTEIEDTQRRRDHKRGQGSTHAWKNLKGDASMGGASGTESDCRGKQHMCALPHCSYLDFMNMHPTTVPSGGEDLNDAPRCGLCHVARMCDSDAHVTNPFARHPARRATGAGELLRPSQPAPAAA